MCTTADFNSKFPLTGPLKDLEAMMPTDADKTTLYANRELFEKFLDKLQPFSKNANGEWTHEWHSTVGYTRKDTLQLSADPANFGFEVTSANHPDLKGPQIKCDNLQEGECTWDPKIKVKNLHCEVTTGTPKTFPYSFREAPREETLHIAGKVQKSTSLSGFPLLNRLFNAPNEEVTIPLQRSLWSYPMIGAGVAGAVFCGYRTIQELQKVFSSAKPASTSNSKAADPKKQRAEKEEQAKKQALKEAAKKQALIYGVATIASTIFAAIAYYKGLYCPQGFSETTCGSCHGHGLKLG